PPFLRLHAPSPPASSPFPHSIELGLCPPPPPQPTSGGCDGATARPSYPLPPADAMRRRRMESRPVTATGGKPRCEEPPLAPHLSFLRRTATADARAGASCSGCDGERWWARMRRLGTVSPLSLDPVAQPPPRTRTLRAAMAGSPSSSPKPTRSLPSPRHHPRRLRRPRRPRRRLLRLRPPLPVAARRRLLRPC
ncbi:unnamed protein product, partial [Urochloa humidicola]